MKTSLAGVSLLKVHEGCRLKAYRDTGGVWTIGYGHTRGVKQGDTCTQAQADTWLAEDLHGAEHTIAGLVSAPLVQNQFDALASFVYNVGEHAFAKSAMRSRINEGNYMEAGAQFDRWVYDNGKIINGLVLRRADEKALFLS